MFQANVLQLLSGFLLVVLFFVVFYKYPLKKDSKFLVLASLFVILNAVLNALAIVVPFFGIPSLKVSLALLPLMVAGVVLPPSWAYLVGLTSDIVGLLLVPTSFPFLGFTLNHVLIALIPSLWYQQSKTLHGDTIMRLVQVMFLLIAFTASIYMSTLDKVSINQSEFIVNTTLKTSLIIAIAMITIGILIAIHYVYTSIDAKFAIDFAKWVFIILIIEVLVQFILTPFWLDAMYGIPWYLSMFIRVVKSIVMIPLQIFIGFSILKIMKRSKLWVEVKTDGY